MTNNGTVEPQWTKGERMRKLRLSADIKSYEMATLLGVTRGTVNNWETGGTVTRGQLTAWAFQCAMSPSAKYFAGQPQAALDWMETGSVDLTDQPKGARSCTAEYWASLPTFNPDDLPKLFDDSYLVKRPQAGPDDALALLRKAS